MVTKPYAGWHPDLSKLANGFRPKERQRFESEPVNLPPPRDLFCGDATGKTALFFKAPYDVERSYRKANFANERGNKSFDARYNREMRKLRGGK